MGVGWAASPMICVAPAVAGKAVNVGCRTRPPLGSVTALRVVVPQAPAGEGVVARKLRP